MNERVQKGFELELRERPRETTLGGVCVWTMEGGRIGDESESKQTRM